MAQRRRQLIGALVLCVPFVIQLWFALGLADTATFGGPTLLFWVVVIAAGLCAVVAAALMWYSVRTNAPELSWVGLYFWAASVLPLVHGITTPGVLYGDNTATMVSVMWAVPFGLVTASPLALGRHHFVRTRWRAWMACWIVVVLLAAVVLLVSPNLVPMIDGRSPVGLTVIAASLTGSVLLGLRQIQLARIADRRGPLVLAGGFAFVGGATAVLLGSSPFSAGFWFAHVLDITGVFAGAIGGLVVYRRSHSMAQVLAPVVAVDPVAALEVGMHPDVIRFVDDLDDKDPLTRDHVVRTAELAIEVAELMRLPAEVQREAGLVGVLHDIGKVRVPDEILRKPGKLTDIEWRIMRSHAEQGGDIVASTPPLADLAPAVRGHHERIDGGGYPDGLAGEQIPLVARIISVCDAFDAMAYTRRYRSGMELHKVIGILREHAGTQFDLLVVQAVITVISRRRSWEPQLLTEEHRNLRCHCVPDEVLDEPSPGELVAAGAFSRHD